MNHERNVRVVYGVLFFLIMSLMMQDAQNVWTMEVCGCYNNIKYCIAIIIRLQRGSTNTQRRRVFHHLLYHRVLFVLHFLLRVDSKDSSASTWKFSEVSASDRHQLMEVEERHQSIKQDEASKVDRRKLNVVVDEALSSTSIGTYSSLQLLTLVTGE